MELRMFREFFEGLKEKNPSVSSAEWKKAEEILHDKIKNTPPPTIAIIGLTGVGKSSTINALFNAGLEVSHFQPCTQVPEPIEGNLYELTGQHRNLIIYDMPGLGESEEADVRHHEAYAQVLPTVDVALWILETPVRVITPIQLALREIRRRSGSATINKIVFAANKVDRIHPEGSWINQANMPSREQEGNITSFTRYLQQALSQEVSNPERSIIPYSALRRYNLEYLMEQIGSHAPDSRAWLFGDVANVADFRELVDPRFLEWIEVNRSRLGDQKQGR